VYVESQSGLKEEINGYCIAWLNTTGPVQPVDGSKLDQILKPLPELEEISPQELRTDPVSFNDLPDGLGRRGNRYDGKKHAHLQSSFAKEFEEESDKSREGPPVHRTAATADDGESHAHWLQQKRYLCRQSFNFNPVSGRCQPNLVVRSRISYRIQSSIKTLLAKPSGKI